MVMPQQISRYRAPALDKGLDIVELLAATDESLSQAEIAKALGRSPNEIYRMLDRLVHRQYITMVNGGRYELTLKLFALAHQHAPMRRLVSQAMPVMREFARETEQACHLAVFDRGSILVVAQVDSPNYWGLSIRVGARVGLINTGSGHVLLAFATPKERAFMLGEREAMPGEKLPARFDRHLDGIRRDGCEVMKSLQTHGVVNLSVPVVGPSGTAIAAFTCPFLSRADRSDAPTVDAVIDALKRFGRQLSQVAGGTEADELRPAEPA